MRIIFALTFIRAAGCPAGQPVSHRSRGNRRRRSARRRNLLAASALGVGHLPLTSGLLQHAWAPFAPADPAAVATKLLGRSAFDLWAAQVSRRRWLRVASRCNVPLTWILGARTLPHSPCRRRADGMQPPGVFGSGSDGGDAGRRSARRRAPPGSAPIEMRHRTESARCADHSRSSRVTYVVPPDRRIRQRSREIAFQRRFVIAGCQVPLPCRPLTSKRLSGEPRGGVIRQVTQIFAGRPHKTAARSGYDLAIAVVIVTDGDAAAVAEVAREAMAYSSGCCCHAPVRADLDQRIAQHDRLPALPGPQSYAPVGAGQSAETSICSSSDFEISVARSTVARRSITASLPNSRRC